MSNLGGILALVGAGMGGYAKGRRQYMDEQADQEDRDFKRQQRARMQAEWEREDQARRAMADASQPQNVQTVAAPPNPDTMGEDGQPIRERPLPDTYTVGGRNFGADQTGAQSFAAQANSPRAVMERQAAAVQGIDPVRAASLRATAMQQRAQELNLDKAEREHLDTLFTQSLNRADSHQALAQLMSDSGSGPSKFETVLSPDGKRVAYVRVMPDGTKQAIPGDFSNDAKGLEQAKVMLNDRVPASAKLAHLHQEAQAQQQADQLAEQQRHNRATEQNAADAAALRLEAATLRARMGAGAKVDHFDEKQWDTAAGIDKEMTAGPDDGTGKPAQVPELRMAWTRVFNEAKASGQMSPNEARENAMTAVALLRQKAEAVMTAAPKDKPITYGQAVRQVLQQAEQVRQQPPAPPAAPAPAAAAPRARMTGQEQAQALAGPAPFQDFVAKNITTPEGKRAIYQRAMKELPELQRSIQEDATAMANPHVAPEVKAKLKQRIDANANTAQMMQAFVDGNPGM